MEEIFRKLIANGFADMSGLTANASIPISQSLANEIIAIALRGDQAIYSCLIAIHDQNRVSAHLKTRLWLPPLRLKLKLDRSVDFASFSSPKIRMWLENQRLLGSLGAFFNALPKWAKLYGNQMVIDVGSFLRTPEEKRFFKLIRSIAIRTEEGRVIFDIKIEVDS